jgi:hypothetical protein
MVTYTSYSIGKQGNILRNTNKCLNTKIISKKDVILNPKITHNFQYLMKKYSF